MRQQAYTRVWVSIYRAVCARRCGINERGPLMLTTAREPIPLYTVAHTAGEHGCSAQRAAIARRTDLLALCGGRGIMGSRDLEVDRLRGALDPDLLHMCSPSASKLKLNVERSALSSQLPVQLPAASSASLLVAPPPDSPFCFPSVRARRAPVYVIGPLGSAPTPIGRSSRSEVEVLVQSCQIPSCVFLSHLIVSSRIV